MQPVRADFGVFGRSQSHTAVKSWVWVDLEYRQIERGWPGTALIGVDSGIGRFLDTKRRRRPAAAARHFLRNAGR